MRMRDREGLGPAEPTWYKDAVLYELHVRAFCDSDGDGVGDFRGLAEKLDYLQDLGVTAIWLLPFYPSPLKDDGYDIADYTSVHPAYGTLADFKAFLREAHQRGLRVVAELILNHTSDQHPWFQRARRAPPGSPWRDFYVWSDTPERYKETRVLFKDFEGSNWSWDRVANAYYWHRFYAHQPDLNYGSAEVRKAIFQVVDFWLGMGVDGLRMDAVPYLYEGEGTNCENLPETHAFLKSLRRHVDEKFGDRMLLAEANQWPEDAVAYFGAGDECHMAFHFPLMPRMFMAVRMEDRFPILDILEQTPPIPETCQWALFLRNHDELTLEMVTDEERDYMYRVYAHDRQARVNLGIRRRLFPLLGKDRKKVELMTGLLFSLPGTPVTYYGDEIGMGDNIFLGDRNGVRTPMQWSADRNAGFSTANPQRLFLPVNIDPDYHYEVVNVEVRQNNPHSPLWWMKRLIALRKHFKAFGRGTLEILRPENRKVLAFVRRYQDERILVVANLSRFIQYAELDLSAFEGMVPVELFGRTAFPAVEKRPYLFTLGPHNFFWFALKPQPVAAAEVAAVSAERSLPVLRVAGGWERVFRREAKGGLEGALLTHLPMRRWFRGKGRGLKAAEVWDIVPLPHAAPAAQVVLTRVEYLEGEPETYLLVLATASGEEAEQVRRESPDAVVARLLWGGREGILYEALREKGVCEALLQAVAAHRRFRGAIGEVIASPTPAFRHLHGPAEASLLPALLKAEQGNSAVLYGDRLILKLFRRPEEGVNPDLEIGSFLTEKAAFPHAPPVAGALEYRRNHGEPMTLAVLQGFVSNQGDAWRYTLDALDQFFEHVAAHAPRVPEGLPAPRGVPGLLDEPLPPLAHEMIGAYLEAARLLGQRTGELHLALASQPDDPNFAPEPYSALYLRSLYQSMRTLTARAFQHLRTQLAEQPEAVGEEGRKVLDGEGEILRRFRALLERKITAMRIRIHGHYHLGQVLFTGKDFVIIDFEGDPARSLSERRIKRSPLRDVVGMVRSFDAAVHVALFDHAAGGPVRPQDLSVLEPWGRCWTGWVSATFLRAYLEVAGRGIFLPRSREELATLLDVYLLEKVIQGLEEALAGPGDGLTRPLRAILRHLEAAG